MTQPAPSTSTWKPEPKGIAGWLILPAIGIICMPLKVIAEALLLFPKVADSWPLLRPPVQSLVIWEQVSNAVVLVLTMWLAVLFFKKRRQVPSLFVKWMLLIFFIQLADLLFAAIVMPNHETPIEDQLSLGRFVLAMAIWCTYFVKSKRLKNTFVE